MLLCRLLACTSFSKNIFVISTATTAAATATATTKYSFHLCFPDHCPVSGRRSV